MPAQTWTISELVREFEITPRTIRFYEDHGIVSPARDGMHRIYSARDRTRLRLALRGKRLGLQLAQIRHLIDMYDSPRDTLPQLKLYLQVLQTHRLDLEQRQRDIAETLADIGGQEAQCRELLKRHTL